MTYFRSDGWVKSPLGQAIAGAQIYVCSQPADVSYVPPIPQVALFADAAGATSLAQPVITDGFGHYDFYVPYGTYTVVVVNGGNIQQVYTDQTIGFSTVVGGVSSVFNRTGSVAAQAGDYSAFYDPLGAAAAAVVGLAPLNNPSFTGTIQIVNAFITGTLKDGASSVGTPGQLLSSTGTGTAWVPAPSGGAVTSVFGRVAAVTAQSGDYGVGDVTGAAPLASPTFTGTVKITNALKDGSDSAGTPGYVLSSTGTATAWVVAPSGGSGTKITLGTNASFKSAPPAGPNAGDSFICTDSPFSYIYDGAAWQAFVFGYNVKEPSNSNSTVNDTSSATIDYTHGGVLVKVPAKGGSGNTTFGVYQAIPATGAYYVDIAYMQFSTYQNSGAGVALAAGNTTSDKFVAMKMGYEPGVGSGYMMFERQEQNSYNSFNDNVTVTPGTLAIIQSCPLMWMRIYDDRTTNRTWYASSDGYNWIQVYQEARDHFNGGSITPAYGGFSQNNFSNNWDTSYHLVHLSIHA